MKERFTGKALLDALMRQELVSCDPKAARAIARNGKVVNIKQGAQFIKEGDSTSEVFLILQGTADVSIKKTTIASRSEGQHVGEMAPLLNAYRTASVTARTPMVAVKIAGSQFRALGERFPNIWHGVARMLAIRLDQRRNLIREPNIRPLVFIASASESKAVAHQLKEALTDQRWDVEVWDDPQVFLPSSTILTTLVDKAKKADFGIVVFGRDDKTKSRKQNKDSPRDNAVLEGGLFIGAVGLERTYFLIPGGRNYKKPTDLDGVVTLAYKISGNKVDITATTRSIRERVVKLMTR